MIAVVCAAQFSSAHGQTPTITTNRSSAPQALYFSSHTNLVSVSRAVEVASGLYVGMKEMDAYALLARGGITNTITGTNGLTSVYSLSVGNSRGWTTGYPLAQGCSIDLKMRASEVRTDGLWGGNGLLEAAFIRSNGVGLISITLTNRPKS